MSVRAPRKLIGLELVAEPLETSPELGYTSRWLKPPSQLKVGDRLGSGIFGTAVKVTRADIQGPDGREAEFVAKLFPKSHSYNTKANVENEVRMIRKVKSEHIVRCFVLYENKEYFVAIFELAKGGDLSQRLVKKGQATGTQAFSEKEAASIIAQVLDAVGCIHRNNIIHRDIKTGNIFFKDAQEGKNRILLGDFGFSIGKDVEEKGTPGTLNYASPELLLGENYGQKIDVWAIGVVAFEILSGILPFPSVAQRNVHVVLQIEYHKRRIIRDPVKFSQPVWSNISEDGEIFADIAKTFILGCLEKDPEKRMSAEEALKHDWIIKNTNAATKFNPKEKWSDPELLKKVIALNISTAPTSRPGSEARVDAKKERKGRTESRGVGKERAATPSPAGREVEETPKRKSRRTALIKALTGKGKK